MVKFSGRILFLQSLFFIFFFAVSSAALGRDAPYIPLREWFEFDDSEGFVQEIDLPL